MRDNARMFFIVTIISTVAFSAIGTLVGFASMTKEIMDRPIAFHYQSKQGNSNEPQHLKIIDEGLKKHNISDFKNKYFIEENGGAVVKKRHFYKRIRL